MRPEALRQLLTEVAAGRLTPEQAQERLALLPFEDLGFARVDHHRALRGGFPEVIFGQGKTVEQILAIAERIVAQGGPLLATRLSPEATRSLEERFPGGKSYPASRAFAFAPRPIEPGGAGTILIVAAGTGDLPVAEEAAVTAELMGQRVERLVDVGVAGLHRLLSATERLRQAAVIVVVAGMEGALPSVVAGLTSCPVIAVPTSVGYGTGLGGFAALLSMLNACAPGVLVVNIDNGFGAGFAASLINGRRQEAG
ncbi:MAG: nickel pincer cofactor biosynthesis protein LarB [Myxococcales bacterium]|nr:nickel pincer cofactor biosynthesis protein LarB [Myxococcales bacterium]